jgi:hypothetical protein
MDPEAFVRDFLLEHLELLHVVVGYNVNFGRDRAGRADTLRTLGTSLGFGVDVVGPVVADGEEVSIRGSATPSARATWRRAAASPRPSRTRSRGASVTGDRAGGRSASPTANLHLKPGLLIPPDGVYAIAADVGGVARQAAVPQHRRPPDVRRPAAHDRGAPPRLRRATSIGAGSWCASSNVCGGRRPSRDRTRSGADRRRRRARASRARARSA